jgi:hypothetical protein
VQTHATWPGCIEQQIYDHVYSAATDHRNRNSASLPTDLNRLFVIAWLAHLAQDCIRLQLDIAGKQGSPPWTEIGFVDI